MSKKAVKYRLIQGSHSFIDEKGERSLLRTGSELMLPPDYVAHFPGKFEMCTVPDTSDEIKKVVDETPVAPPAAPTIDDLIMAIEQLPTVYQDPDKVYEHAQEALISLRGVFGELLHDGYAADVVLAFETPGKEAEDASAASTTPKASKASKASKTG